MNNILIGLMANQFLNKKKFMNLNLDIAIENNTK